MKRVLTLVLTIILVIGCLSLAHAEEMPRYKYGILYYSLTDTLGTEVVHWAEKFGEMFGCEVQCLQVEGTDANITGVENLCAAGCDVILSCFVDAGLPRVLQICEEYGVYFGAINREVPSEEIQATIEAMPAYKWWVGGVKENEYQAGYNVVKSLIDLGCQKFALIGRAPGSSSSHDDRYAGFLDALKDAGLEPVAEARGNNDEQAEFINNMLTMDIDAMAITGGGMDKAIQPISAAGLTGKVKLGTIDVGGGAIEALENKYIDCVLGCHSIDVLFSMMNAYNYLGGCPLRDEPSNFTLNYWVVDSVEVYEMYLEKCVGDVFPFTIDELKSVMKPFNSEATYEDMQALIDTWTPECISAKVA